MHLEICFGSVMTSKTSFLEALTENVPSKCNFFALSRSTKSEIQRSPRENPDHVQPVLSASMHVRGRVRFFVGPFGCFGDVTSSSVFPLRCLSALLALIGVGATAPNDTLTSVQT